MLITRVIPVLPIGLNIPDVIWHVTPPLTPIRWSTGSLSYLERRGALWWISASCWWGWSRRRALRRRCRRSGFWCCTPWRLCFPAGWPGDPETTSHCPRIGWWCGWATPLATLCCRRCTWKEKTHTQKKRKRFRHLRRPSLQHSSHTNTTWKKNKNKQKKKRCPSLIMRCKCNAGFHLN